MPLAANLLESAAQSVVKSATFRSQLTPTFTWDPWSPTPPAPPGGGSGWLMEIVKPAVDIETQLGPVTIAPYGEPTEEYGTLAAVGGLATLVGVVFLIGWIARVTKS